MTAWWKLPWATAIFDVSALHLASFRFPRKTLCGASIHPSILAIPALVMMSRYFTTSSARNVLDLSRSSPTGTAPISSNRTRTAGSFSASFSTAFNRCKISFGTPAGAPRPNQPSNVYGANPACAVVTVFGSTGSRASPATASATAPSAASGPDTFGYQANPSCTVPAIKSGPNCAMLRYGTWVSFTSATSAKYSPARCCDEPIPTDP
jgi:hypothetical protein